jgi:hypothetical protein
MAARADRVRLTVYSRNYCHLCEEMITGLRLLQAGFRFELEIVDVDQDPELDRCYGEQVPVLVHAGDEICRHRLDAAVLTDYLAKIC